jgi:uncharacterized damage-inducible protein DinB
VSLVAYFRAMAHSNACSNFRLLAACARLSQEDFEARRVSFFPSLKLTLNHILAVDRYYLDALEDDGRGPAVRTAAAPCATVAALQQEQTTSDRRLIRFCDELTAPRLAAPVPLARPGGTVVDRVDRVVAHLFLHQVHHRGQAHAMLAGTSVPPPQLDDFLLASDAPARAADLAALGFRETDLWPG